MQMPVNAAEWLDVMDAEMEVTEDEISPYSAY